MYFYGYWVTQLSNNVTTWTTVEKLESVSTLVFVFTLGEKTSTAHRDNTRGSFLNY